MRIEVSSLVLAGSAASVLLVSACRFEARVRAGETEGLEAASSSPAATRFDRTKRSVALPTGLTMSYVEAGEPTGEPVILLHGYTDTSRSFYPTIEALVSAGTELHLFALDQRGHGTTDMPPAAACAPRPERCFAAAELAADVIGFMDRSGIARASLVGHSMGSLVAQELAIAYPERVRRLVLIGAIVNGPANPVLNDFLLGALVEGAWKTALVQRDGFRWPDDAYLLTPLDVDPEMAVWMRENWVADPTADGSFLEEILPETLGTRLGTWIGAIRVQTEFDNRERLAQLRVPTLVLWATQDGFFPEEPDQAALRSALDAAVEACRTEYHFKVYGKQPLPGSGLQESDLGHNTQWGAPATVAADIEAFVRSGRPTPDLPYADPENVGRVRVEQGTARILERRPPPACAEVAPSRSSPS